MKRHHNTTHHLVPTSRGGTSNEVNLLRLDRTVHDAIHRIFNNAAPHEQLGDILNLNTSVIIEPTIEEIRDVIARTIRDKKFYEGGVSKGDINDRRIYRDANYRISDNNG